MRLRISRIICLSSWIALVFCNLGIGLAHETKTILSGQASVYDRSSGALTASGESLREDALTAAHRSLPFGTVVAVINNENGRTALVRINDRGPFVRGRVIDLTPAAARALGISGLANVLLDIVSAANPDHQ
jgi:rare lipoprotein A